MNCSFSSLLLEALEARIAPAALVTFQDTDGDIVKVQTSKGTDTDLTNALTIVGGQLEKVDFTANDVFKDTSLSISVQTRDPNTGDGLVNVGFINAAGMDLGAVTVGGDLGKIVAGDQNQKSPGLASLRVHSMGLDGIATQGGTGDLDSTILGPTTSVRIDTDLKDATLTWNSTSSKASVNSITVGGDIVGGDASLGDGAIRVQGMIFKMSVGGDIIGGTGVNTGQVVANNMQHFHLDGSLIGGTATETGMLDVSDRLLMASVDGSLVGGSGGSSGSISAGSLDQLSVGGSLVGDTGNFSGSVVVAGGVVTKIDVGGSLIGGDGASSGSLQISDVKTTTFEVGGSLIGGAGDNSGSIYAVSGTDTKFFGDLGGSLTGGDGDHSGSIFMPSGAHGADLKSLSIGGSVVGGAGDHSGFIGGSLASFLSIGGDLQGGSGADSGEVSVDNTNTASFKLGGNLIGGSAADAGSVQIDGSVVSFFIGGDVVGGTAVAAGGIFLTGTDHDSVHNAFIGGNLQGGQDASHTGVFEALLDVGVLKIQGSVIGGTNTTATSMVDSGMIRATETLGSLTIGHSLISGTTNTANDLNLGAVRAGTLGSLTVHGSIVGHDANYFLVTGQRNSTIHGHGHGRSNLAISSVEVDGSVTDADIIAGYNTTGTTINGDGADANGGTAQIGSVLVEGDWISSSLAAGVSTGASGRWGNVTNVLLNQPGGNSLVASIAKIVIDGEAKGGTLLNGFVAESLLSLQVADDLYPITPSTTVIQVGPNPELVARQVS